MPLLLLLLFLTLPWSAQGRPLAAVARRLLAQLLGLSAPCASPPCGRGAHVPHVHTSDSVETDDHTGPRRMWEMGRPHHGRRSHQPGCWVLHTKVGLLIPTRTLQQYPRIRIRKMKSTVSHTRPIDRGVLIHLHPRCSQKLQSPMIHLPTGRRRQS